MTNKIHKSKINSSEKFWYIYQGGGKCQLVHVLSDDDFDGTFEVQFLDGDKWFSSFPIRIDTDEDGFVADLFYFKDKANAEILWCHYFIKDFQANTFVDYGRFATLTKVLLDEYPELLLKGL